MKIMGVVFIAMVLMALPGDSFAKMTCKGSMYSRFDNGELGFEKVHVMEIKRDAFVVRKEGSNFRFDFEPKSDEWVFYTYTDQAELLHMRGYRETVVPYDYYRDLRPNKESFFKFKDNSILGFNFVCRM